MPCIKPVAEGTALSNSKWIWKLRHWEAISILLFSCQTRGQVLLTQLQSCTGECGKAPPPRHDFTAIWANKETRTQTQWKEGLKWFALSMIQCIHSGLWWRTQDWLSWRWTCSWCMFSYFIGTHSNRDLTCYPSECKQERRVLGTFVSKKKSDLSSFGYDVTNSTGLLSEFLWKVPDLKVCKKKVRKKDRSPCYFKSKTRCGDEISHKRTTKCVHFIFQFQRHEILVRG